MILLFVGVRLLINFKDKFIQFFYYFLFHTSPAESKVLFDYTAAGFGLSGGKEAGRSRKESIVCRFPLNSSISGEFTTVDVDSRCVLKNVLLPVSLFLLSFIFALFILLFTLFMLLFTPLIPLFYYFLGFHWNFPELFSLFPQYFDALGVGKVFESDRVLFLFDLIVDRFGMRG